VLHLAGIDQLIKWVELHSYWFGSSGFYVRGNGAIVGILQTIAYGFAASLIPWVGCRWIDYWTPMTQECSKQPGEANLVFSSRAEAESLSTALLDPIEIPKAKTSER